jgi:hypothetical protein
MSPMFCNSISQFFTWIHCSNQTTNCRLSFFSGCFGECWALCVHYEKRVSTVRFLANSHFRGVKTKNCGGSGMHMTHIFIQNCINGVSYMILATVNGAIVLSLLSRLAYTSRQESGGEGREGEARRMVRMCEILYIDTWPWNVLTTGVLPSLWYYWPVGGPQSSPSHPSTHQLDCQTFATPDMSIMN